MQYIAPRIKVIFQMQYSNPVVDAEMEIQALHLTTTQMQCSMNESLIKSYCRQSIHKGTLLYRLMHQASIILVYMYKTMNEINIH